MLRIKNEVHRPWRTGHQFSLASAAARRAVDSPNLVLLIAGPLNSPLLPSLTPNRAKEYHSELRRPFCPLRLGAGLATIALAYSGLAWFVFLAA